MPLNRMPKGDELCPLGFAPHTIRPTRCKRCFRDYSEHKKKNNGSKLEEKSSSSKEKDGETKKGPKSVQKPDEATEEENATKKLATPKRPLTSLQQRTRSRDTNQAPTKEASIDPPSAAVAASGNVAPDEDTTAVVRRRRPIKEDEGATVESEAPKARQRTRPGSWSGSVVESLEKERGAATPRSGVGSFRDKEKGGGGGKEKEKEEQESITAAAVPRRIQILSAQELRSSVVDESIIPESTSADVEFMLQVKTSTFNQGRRDDDDDDDDNISIAPTETTETTLTYHDSIEDLQATIQTLKKQCEEWESKCGKLEADKRELQQVKTSEKDKESLEKTAAELLKLRAKIFELESTNEDVRDENHVLKLEVKELQDEVDQRPPVEEMTKKMTELQQKLHAAETMCEELVEENEEYKKELSEMEDEIDEMQDSFREDQADEYRDLRKELEQTTKNCRILQFKMRKTERRCEQLESEKNEVEDKLKLITNADNIDMDKIERIKSLEVEVKAAREISTKMHQEMETFKVKLRQAEVERDALSRTSLEGGEKQAIFAGSKPKDNASKHQSAVIQQQTETSKNNESDDSVQLMRELYDSMEREKDLKEQLKFSEAEATSLRKKLTSLEEENESVMLQLKKMASARATKGGRRAAGSTQKEADSGLPDDSPEEEFSMAELKLQMELVEQEASVLRKKLKEMEEENESLNKEVKFLEGALSDKTTPSNAALSPPPVGQQTDVYYEQRIKMMENEAKELRRKLIEKERENEQLTTEMNVKASRRGSKTVPAVQRSRSLDSDVQIDLRRQLQLVEQEAGVLRQKTLDLENENDKVCAENRKLQIRGNKKGPMTSSEKLAMENLQLKETVTALEKKMQQIQGEASSNTSKEEVPSPKKSKEETDANNSAAPKKGLLSTKLKEQVTKLESEMAVLKKRVEELEKENNSLKKLKNSMNYKRKASKKITEASSKQEMKCYIEELEEELKNVSSPMASSHDGQNKCLQDELEVKWKAELEKVKGEMEALKINHLTELQKTQKKNAQLSEQLEEETKKAKQVEEEKQEIKKAMESSEKANMRAQKKLSDGEINTLKKKVETLEKDLANEKQSHNEVKKKIGQGELVDFEVLRKVEEEKHKLRKENLENTKKSSDLEKKITELEHTIKDCGKSQRSSKRELEEAQKELENERMKLKKVDSRQSEVAVGWLKEREELKKQMMESEQIRAEQMEQEERKYKAKIADLEKEISEEKKNATKTIKEKDGEFKRLVDQLEDMKLRAEERDREGPNNEYLEKWKKLDNIYKKEKDEWMTVRVDLEGELKAEKKRRERRERDHDAELKDRDEDMLTLKDKIRRAEGEVKKLLEQRGDSVGHLEDRLKDLEKELAREKQEYEDLTAKYELLEEDYVIVKAQGVMAKEQIQSNFNSLRRDHTEVEGELKTLRETFNIRQDTWIKEKLDMQEKIKELSGKLSRTNASAWDLERARLKDLIDEKSSLNEQLKKDVKAHKEEIERLKRQVEETKRMLDDYARVKSYGKNISVDELATYEKEIQDLKNKLQHEEKAHRSEMAATKMKMDQRVAHLQDEIHALHLQNAKSRRERETVKEMLDGAQKTIADLKTDTIRKDKSTKIIADMDEIKQKLDEMRKEKEEILDKLDVAERNCSRLKTEYMTDRASWEIHTAEMQTKINELEETTIIQGGRSKIFGVKTKLELAWQKEREEQHRLLTESHKMARDLKQRLLDVEGARDKERLESKRQLDEFRRTVGTEQNDTQTKIEELQKDHLELRDAHSKMRALNDRIKREKARMEGERDELRIFLSDTQQIHSQDRITIGSLVEELQKIKSLIPPILGEAAEESLGKNTIGVSPFPNDDSLKHAFKATLNRISIAADELWRAHGTREEDRVRRNLSFRRAISEDEDDGSGLPKTLSTGRRDDPLSRWQNPQRVTNYPASPPSMYISIPKRQSLYRKSLSLDQNVNLDSIHGQTSSIWKSGESGGSNSSLPTHERQANGGGDLAGPTPSPRLKKHMRRMRQQSSIDSDVSGTSASSRDISIERDQSSSSEISAATKASKKIGAGMKEKFKRLTKAKSIEGTPTAEQIRQAGFQALGPALGNAGSSSSVTSETSLRKEVKGKDLKSRIANLFKKTSSRSSLDKDSLDGDNNKSNTLRPKSSIIAASSTGAKAGTLPRYGSASTINQIGKK